MSGERKSKWKAGHDELVDPGDQTGPGRVGLGSKEYGSSYLAGWTPTSIRTLRAILRCRFHSSMAVAMIRPLRKRKLVSRKYWGHTLLEGRMPKKGKRTMGKRAVTERGRASVHQYTAMSRMTNRQRPSCRGETQVRRVSGAPGHRARRDPGAAPIRARSAGSLCRG